jgi:hypothetical protein
MREPVGHDVGIADQDATILYGQRLIEWIRDAVPASPILARHPVVDRLALAVSQAHGWSPGLRGVIGTTSPPPLTDAVDGLVALVDDDRLVALLDLPS